MMLDICCVGEFTAYAELAKDLDSSRSVGRGSVRECHWIQ